MSAKTKSIIFPPSLEDSIQRRADEEERSFTRQVIYMLHDYLYRQADCEARLGRIEDVVKDIANRLPS